MGEAVAEYRDLFGRVPLRLIDALKRREVTFDGFAIVAFFCSECWRSGNHEAIYTFAGLSDALDYPKSLDALSRHLKRLRPEWIDFETKQGQRTPVVFRLTGALIESVSTSFVEDGSDAEVAAEERRLLRKSEVGANGPVQAELPVAGNSGAEVATEVPLSNLVSSSKTSKETNTSVAPALPQRSGPGIIDRCLGCGEHKPMAFEAIYCDECQPSEDTHDAAPQPRS